LPSLCSSFPASTNVVTIGSLRTAGAAGDPEFSVWPEHCRIDDWGWQIAEELAPGLGELVCRKNRYDAFYDSWLGYFLSRVWQVEHVVIVGTAANICVLRTAASLGLRWCHVVRRGEEIRIGG